MALTPWPAPTATATLNAAVSALRAALDENPNPSDPYVVDALDTELRRMGSSVAARVMQYSPGAPQAVRDEALIRAVAWLRDSRGATRVTGLPMGLTFDQAPTNSGAWFTHSGARSMLSPWRRRRAGLVQEET